MFRHGIPIGKIFGIRIDLDYSWFLIVALMAWVLATGYYPMEFKNWSVGEYWVMGLITAVMLFVSVLIHELGHSVVAKSYGLSVPRITLFLFGGVSQIAAEPPSAAAEFWIAAVGPLVSFVLAAIFWELQPLVRGSQPVFALFKYMALINFALGLFNLIPGFPLDGGRVFRSIIWKATGNYQRATMIAAVTGRFFGFAMIFGGVWWAISGQLFDGVWIAFIGWFLESAAGSQLQQEFLHNLMGAHKVMEAMKRDFPKATADATLEELVDRYMVPAGTRYVILNGASGPAGLVTLTAIRTVPHDQWRATHADRVMVPLEKLDTTQPDVGLWTAMEKMGRDGVNQLPVVDGNGIVGVLSRDDVVHYLQMLQAVHA
jgi:Zn-dependent protease/CBS domain-containing protein